MNQERYIISDAAKKINVESHVLRYWEEELALDIPRNEMGHRYYREEDIALLKSIKQLKEEGFQLRAIKMILPDINKIEKLDPKSILRLREELNEQVFSMERAASEKSELHKDKREVQASNNGTSVVSFERKATVVKNRPAASDPESSEIPADIMDKMSEFKAIMYQLISEALEENNRKLTDSVGGKVSERVIKEMDYMMRVKEEREEDRFKRLDESIRGHQKSRKEIAATDLGKPGKKKKKGLFHR